MNVSIDIQERGTVEVAVQELVIVRPCLEPRLRLEPHHVASALIFRPRATEGDGNRSSTKLDLLSVKSSLAWDSIDNHSQTSWA